MKILAFDTSTEYCSVALFIKGEVAIRECHAGQRHSELILPMINELLEEASLNVNQLDGIAFGKGPGSFTGLRIACGVAQGLAFGADVPVVGVPTLQAMAAAEKAEYVLTCLDARMNEIYHAAYHYVGDDWKTISEPGLFSPHQAPLLPNAQWVACGNGFEIYKDILLDRYKGQLDKVDAKIFPHAREIAQLAVSVFARGQGVDAANTLPLYLRNKVALTTKERLNLT